MRTLLLSGALVLAFAVAAHASKPISADQISAPQPLLPYCSWLPDPEGSQTIANITSGALQQRFVPLSSGFPLKGEGPVWLQLVIIKNLPGASGAPDASRVSVNFGALPPGETYIYMSKAPGRLDDEGGWHAERVFPHEVIDLPEPGLLPVSIYIRMDEMPGPWFAPTVSAKNAVQPDVLPSEFILPGLFLAACAACLLRAVAERAQWALWSAMFLLCALTQTLLPMPSPSQGFRPEHLPALLAPGMSLILLPHIGRCMFRTSSLPLLQDRILHLCSFIGVVVALIPLLPGFAWLIRLFPLWSLLLAPLLPLCVSALAARRPGALAFTGACAMPLLGAVVTLYALRDPVMHPLAVQGSLWGLAVGGLGLVLARVPSSKHSSLQAEKTDAPAPAGLTLAEASADDARARTAGRSLTLAKPQDVARQSQYDELPPLDVIRLDTPPPRNDTEGGVSSELPDVAMPGSCASGRENPEAPLLEPLLSADSPPPDAPFPATPLSGASFMPGAAEMATEAVCLEQDMSAPPFFNGHRRPDDGNAPVPTKEAAPAGTPLLMEETRPEQADDFRAPAGAPEEESPQCTELLVLSDQEEEAPVVTLLADSILSPAELAWFAKLGIFAAAPKDGTPAPDKQQNGAGTDPSAQTFSPDSAPEPVSLPNSAPATDAGERNAGCPPEAANARPASDLPPQEPATVQSDDVSPSGPDPDQSLLQPPPAEKESLPDSAPPSQEQELRAGVNRPVMKGAPHPQEETSCLSLVDDEFSSLSVELQQAMEEEAARQASFATENGFLFSLHSLVREVHTVVAPLAQNRGLVFSWYISPLLPPFLEGDSPRLRGALTLLLQNAVLATRRGAVQLAVRKNPGSTDPGDLLFVISDSGSAQRTEAGFFHAWEMAARTGGVFNVEYSPLGGTQISFTVRFALPSEQAAGELLEVADVRRSRFAEEDGIMPVLNNVLISPGESWTTAAPESAAFKETLQGAAAPVSTPLLPAAPLREAQEPSPPAQSYAPVSDIRRILAAEMTTSNRRLIAHYLTDLPHEHIDAAVNRQVPDLFRAGPLSLIIFDGDTPEHDIIRAMQAVRDEERKTGRERTAVLVLTSHEAQSARLLENGATHALIKPVNKEELFAVAAGTPAVTPPPASAPSPVDSVAWFPADTTASAGLPDSSLPWRNSPAATPESGGGEVDLLAAALRDAPEPQGAAVEVPLPPRHYSGAPHNAPAAAEKPEDSPGVTKRHEAAEPAVIPYGNTTTAAPMLLNLSLEDVLPAAPFLTGADFPAQNLADGRKNVGSAAVPDHIPDGLPARELSSETDFEPGPRSSLWSADLTLDIMPEDGFKQEDDSPDAHAAQHANGSLLDFALPDFFPSVEQHPPSVGSEAAAAQQTASGRHDGHDMPSDEATGQKAASGNANNPETTSAPMDERGQNHEPALFFPLPGQEGEELDASVLPLAPGLINALEEIRHDIQHAGRRGQSILVQEAAGRLAGTAESFGLVKLGKIARCVERAAEADDMEAVDTLLEDLVPVISRYMQSLRECFDAFLHRER